MVEMLLFFLKVPAALRGKNKVRAICVCVYVCVFWGRGEEVGVRSDWQVWPWQRLAQRAGPSVTGCQAKAPRLPVAARRHRHAVTRYARINKTVTHADTHAQTGRARRRLVPLTQASSVALNDTQNRSAGGGGGGEGLADGAAEA